MNRADFIKEHLGFILTIVITYVIGIILVIIQYRASKIIPTSNSIPNNNSNFMEVFLNSMIPTTITYVLGCVLVNIVDLLENNANNYIYNIFTCFCVMIYAFIFCLYVMEKFTFMWAIFEVVLTVALLLLNLMCYKEKYKNTHHGLV